MTVSCDLCDVQVDELDQSTALLEWTATMDHGKVSYTCPACTRSQVHTIEANLQLGLR